MVSSRARLDYCPLDKIQKSQKRLSETDLRERERERERVMARSEAKPLTVRRPLRDVVNNIGGGGRASRSVNAVPAKKFAAENENEERPRVRAQREGEGDEGEGERDGGDSLDRLLLVQSDLSALVRQVKMDVLLVFFGTRNRILAGKFLRLVDFGTDFVLFLSCLIPDYLSVRLSISDQIGHFYLHNLISY